MENRESGQTRRFNERTKPIVNWSIIEDEGRPKPNDVNA